MHVWQSEWVWDFVGDDNVRLAGLKMDQAGSESFLTAVAVPDFLYPFLSAMVFECSHSSLCPPGSRPWIGESRVLDATLLGIEPLSCP